MDLDIIFFIGPQGSGKGTQAKILAKRLGFFYWENGAILRQIAKEESETGKQVKNLVDNGILLTDDLMFQVAQEKLDSLPKNQGVIFDGLPRRTAQAERLLNMLKQQGRNNFLTLLIDLPKEECVKRMLHRAEVEGRADDTLEKIELRLSQYEKDTVPMIDYLKSGSKFISIDGMPAVETVTNNINSALELK